MRRPVHYPRPSPPAVMIRDLSKLGVDSVSDYSSLKASINIAERLKWIRKKGVLARPAGSHGIYDGEWPVSDDIEPGMPAATVLEHSGAAREI